jgi:integrase
MGISKNRHGTYYAIKQVPLRLQEAVARALKNGKTRQVWLKRSLGTKDSSEANRRAKVVLIEFDRLLERAKELLTERPLRTNLNQSEVDRMAEYYFVTILSGDERMRQEGFDAEAIQAALIETGVRPDDVSKMMVSDPPGTRPKYGLSDSELSKHAANWKMLLPRAERALAKGDIWQVQGAISEVQEVFGINVDPDSAAYRRLGLAFLKQFVKAGRAVQQRDLGKWTDTPPLPSVGATDAATGENLTAAFEGWKRARNRSPRTVQEYAYAIKLFGELHGDMALAAIRKTQARQFRETLQDVPIKRFRTGKLLRATLPQRAAWGREHPDAPKISAGTINKLLGALQSIGRWARKEGIVPDEWADPFADMRLDEDEVNRAPFELHELRAIFAATVFTKGERPKGGQGEAAFWLPLLALFGGERLSELTGLRVSDVTHNELIGAVSIYIAEERKAGRRLKTKQSERFIPVHPQLIELGFLDFVAAQAKTRGTDAWLFPLVAPGTKGTGAYSKWFGRYIGGHGVTDTAKVFHSFRHSYIDALRVANVGDEIKHALLGWSGGGIPARYGAKDKAARFRHRLAEAVGNVSYTGLDLSRVAYHRYEAGEGGTT